MARDFGLPNKTKGIKVIDESMNQKELEKYIANRPSAKESDGAWDKYKEAVKKDDALKNNKMVKHIEKVMEDYGDNEIGKPPILKNNINNRYVNKSLNKFENRTVNKSVVTFDPTTQLFTDDTRNIAFKSYDDAKRWNDKVNKEPTATPDQVNGLKQRIDNSRAYGFNPKVNQQKPFVKTKPIKKHYTMPKVELAPPIHYEPYLKQRDPELERQEKRFRELQRQSELDKQPKGLAYLVGEKEPERRDQKVTNKTTEDYDL